MELFGIEKWEPEETLAPDWNVAPTKEVHVVLDRPVKDAADPRPVRQLRVLKWGLVPSWAKSPEGAARMINARSETVAEKPSFKRPFAQRRCIIPADGYYEWVTAHDERQLEVEGKRKRARKQPYFVLPADGSVFAMAADIRVLARPDPARRAPDGLVGHLLGDHHGGRDRPAGRRPRRGAGLPLGDPPRMPLMLTPDKWDPWLDPARTDPDELGHLLAPPHGRPDARLPGVHRREQRAQQRGRAADGADRAGGGDPLLTRHDRRMTTRTESVDTPAGEARVTWHPATGGAARLVLAVSHGAAWAASRPGTCGRWRRRCPPEASPSPWSSSPGGWPGRRSPPRRRCWTRAGAGCGRR